jgi:hypothetical protein
VVQQEGQLELAAEQVELWPAGLLESVVVVQVESVVVVQVVVVEWLVFFQIAMDLPAAASVAWCPRALALVVHLPGRNPCLPRYTAARTVNPLE